MAKGTVNKCIILGRLGQDPEVRATATGTQVVTLSVATNEVGPKDQNGQRQDITEWHRVVLWARTAEIAAQYLKKGSLVYIEGRLQTRKWQDQQGNDRYTTEIVGFEMQLMGGRDDSAGNQYNQATNQGQRMQQNSQQNQQQPQVGYQQQNNQGRPQQQQPQQNQQQQPNQGNSFDDFDDDIPF